MLREVKWLCMTCLSASVSSQVELLILLCLMASCTCELMSGIGVACNLLMYLLYVLFVVP